MPARRDDDSLDEGYDEEDEVPDEADQDSHDDPETAACPFCGHEVVEEADVCPKCGNFIGDGGGDKLTRRIRPRWVILTAIVILAVIALALMR